MEDESEARVVNLSRIERFEGLEFRTAEIWDDAPSLAIVNISGPRHEDIHLRMDLYKRTFIDFTDDAHLDRIIRLKAPDVWETITRQIPEFA